MQLTRLNLTECISIADHKRIDQDIAPIKSIRALAFELELMWPTKYNSDYIRNRLHRANKKGIGEVPSDLIEDLLYLLDVDQKDLVHHPNLLKKVL